MNRRGFLATAGAGAVLALPSARPTRAQQGRLPVIGVLALGNPPPEGFLKSLRAGLQHFGYSEDRNITLDIRLADGRPERLAQHAAALVAAKVDIIVCYQTPASVAAKQATRDIPIVFGATGDPIGTGLVASYAKPGGNLTGTTAGAVEVAGKTVELIRELMPQASRLAVLANATDLFTTPYLAEIGRVCGAVNLDLDRVLVSPSDRLEAAFARMAANRAQAVVIQGSLVRTDAIELANRHGIPSFGSSPALPRLGGLMAYSADFDAMMRETAGYIDRILKGAKPAELPVTFPGSFVMILNLKTARALNLMIPEAFLQRANEVIE